MTAYFGKETVFVNKQETDKEGRILTLDVSINDSDYILMHMTLTLGRASRVTK